MVKLMTNKELRKMSRSELLEILIAQMEENENLRKQLEAATDELESRKLAVHKAGSLAEAALQLNGIFEAAEAAAEQYLDNVRSASVTAPLSSMSVADSHARLRQQTQAECRKMRSDCEEECKAKLAACEVQCAELKAQAQKQGEQMLNHFKEESRKLYDRAAQVYKAAQKGQKPD